MARTASGNGVERSRRWPALLLWGLLAVLLIAMGVVLLAACRFPWLGLGQCEATAFTGAERLLVESQREDTLRREILSLEEQLASVPLCPVEAPCGVGGEARADLYLLQDLSSSFDEFLPRLEAFGLDLIEAKREGRLGEEVFLGFGSFSDKPFEPFGDPDIDYVFKAHHPLSGDMEAFRETLAGLEIAYGGRAGEEAQYEAMIEVLGAEVGFRGEARRFLIVITDAPPFEAGAWDEAPGPEDGQADGDPANEDYPSVETVSQALSRADVTPIFLVGEPSVVPVYEAFVEAHGEGLVLPLEAESDRLIERLFEAVETACAEGI